MKQLTEDEFDDQFTPIEDANGDSVRPVIGDIDPDSSKLWTIVDCDGALYALSGLHRVNRVGYLLTEEAWTEFTEAVWFPASEDDDDNEEEE